MGPRVRCPSCGELVDLARYVVHAPAGSLLSCPSCLTEHRLRAAPAVVRLRRGRASGGDVADRRAS